MLRAIRPLVLIAFASLAFAAPLAAQNLGKSIDGIGLIDYSRKPNFKVGTYTQYHVTGHSSKGHSEDYRMVVAIAGEERFWGDDCFWVETISQGNAESGGSSVASLMSYSIFGDSLPVQHLQYFVRKSINDVDERGNPREVIAKGSVGGIKSHTKVDPNTHWYSDTLASDSVRVLGKTYWCKRLHTRRDVTNSVERGDSTIMTEYREDRDTYLSPQIPLTGIAREDIEYLETRKAWLAGRSQDAETTVNTHSVGQALLISIGDGLRRAVDPGGQATLAARSGPGARQPAGQGRSRRRAHRRRPRAAPAASRATRAASAARLASKSAAANAPGSKGSQSSSPSPTPTTLTGSSSASVIASSAPPRALPSSLFIARLVTAVARWNSRACASAFCPSVASSTSST